MRRKRRVLLQVFKGYLALRSVFPFPVIITGFIVQYGFVKCVKAAFDTSLYSVDNIILPPFPFGMRAITKPPVQRKTEQTVMLYDVIMHL